MMRPAAGAGKAKDSKRLGELLMEERIITAEQLAEAVQEQTETGGYIGQILVQKGFSTEQVINEYLVKQLKIPRLSLLDYDINEQVLRQIPEEMCLRLRLLAIDKLGRILTVAMVDPLDKDALDEVQQACPDLRIKPILCDWDHFEAVSKRLFGRAPRKPEFYAALRMDALERTAALPVKEVVKSPRPVHEDRDGSDEAELSEAGGGFGPSGLSIEAARELAETLREGLRDALRDVVGGIVPASSSGALADTAALGDLAARIETSVQDSMRMVAEEFRRVSEDLRTNLDAARPGGAPVAAGPSTEDMQNIVSGIQEGVGAAMAQAMASLGAEVRALVEKQAGDAVPQGPATADFGQLVQGIQEGVGAAMANAMASLGDEVRSLVEKQAEKAVPSGPTTADLQQMAQGIQEGVGAVMAQAMDTFGREVRTLVEKQAESAAPSGPTTADLQQMARSIQEGVGAVMAQAMVSLGDEVRALVEKQAEKAVPPGPTAADLEQLAHGIQEGVGAVMAQAMVSLGTEMRTIASQQAVGDDAPKGPTPAEIADAMRQTLGPALESSIANLGRELRDTLSAQQAALPEPPPPPDWGQIAGSIRESVGASVEDAMAAMAVQIKSVFVQKEARDTEEQRRDIALLAERLRETMAEAIAGMREAQQSTMVETVAGFQETQHLQQGELARIAETALHSIAEESKAAREAQQTELARLAEMTLQSIVNARETQETQQSQLAQIAEASMQSVRQTTELIEKHIVNESNRRDLLRGKRARHASVAPFGGVDPDTPPTAEALEADSRLLDALDSETPLESLTFANFFPGTMNEFTHKVCQAVAAAPGGEYNPLFLYGHVGIGKTHLVSAIGNAILTGGGKKKDREKAALPRVGYVSSSHFSRRLAEAIAENAQDAFRENYCHWDVLILDDIQFLGGRVEAQEEFFHIFNALHQQGRQIIIVADKAPDRLGLLEQRLVSRFASGIVAELKAPEWDTRMQILRHRVEQSGVAVPEEILSLIAMRVPGDVRKMTGALRKVAAFAKLIGKSITVEMAQEILSHLGVDEAA